ncbi:PQQ-like beta-propeller repeat protein [Aeoliella sp. ICT_H6.2]|uniref:PQQ-like beta-propeller repeat protein n=1 Tax=Aeoliella straminimaris TaxID=2954799 RepID=A0A9X2FIM7_9BACT|nr:PQQ-like beta-propeller repeat protein [Aeoliella straminimaris]
MDWPQFRGALRDGIARGGTRLARTWPAEGPKVLWETQVGQGYSAPSVVGDRVFLNDYNEDTNEWLVRCLSLGTGEELWTYKVDKRIRPNHSITRSAPSTDGGFVFAIDPKCELHCLDARDGGLIWRKNLPRLYDSPIPPWYNGQCPLIDGDKLILATGGNAVMVALDKATGEPVWKTPNTDEYLLSHSSVMPVEIDGHRQYAYLTLKGAVGVDAASGEMLWSFPWKFNTAVAPSPLDLGEGRLLLTSGYNAQTVVCQVKQEDGKWTATEATAFQPPPRGWNSEVHTPIVHRGNIYGVGKTKRGMWTCLDMEGNELWTSGRQATFGMGGYVLADGMFIALDGKTGTLRLIDAEADEYTQLAEAKLLSGPDVWTPPVVVGGKLLVRDLGKLLCLDISDPSVPIASTSATSGQ